MKVQVKIVIALVALAVIVVPAAAVAHPGHTKNSSSMPHSSARSHAEKQCRQERSRLGKDRFDNTYAPNGNGKNAFGKCVSQKAQQQEQQGSSGSGGGSDTSSS
jgi:hypothetical protein